MANHKSTKKRIRQTEKRRLQNRYFAKTMRNAIRDLRAMETKKDAEAKLGSVISLVDKVAKRNQIHNNKASNIKSKLMKHVNAM
ncbi:MAG: 30S ribosomal protein S20 [Chitinophagales bacterium]